MRVPLTVALLLVLLVLSPTEGGWWRKTKKKVGNALKTYAVGKLVGAAVAAVGKRAEASETTDPETALSETTDPETALWEKVWEALQQACPSYMFDNSSDPPAVASFAYIENDDDKDGDLASEELEEFTGMVYDLDLCDVTACLTAL